jgi:hypothetical protein
MQDIISVNPEVENVTFISDSAASNFLFVNFPHHMIKVFVVDGIGGNIK